MDRSRAMWDGWRSLVERPGAAALALVALCLAVYLPGVLRLPAVDRTEVIWAETTRDMVARGDWTDPRYGDAVHQYRPIGTFWIEGAARWLAGEAHARDIRVYRAPALIFVTLSVLALFWLGRALVGDEAALIAAALLAVAPLTVLVSQLAIAEGLSLLPATVAMMTLARIYAKPENDWPLALSFWIAVGVGMLINALLVPILVIATLIALFAFDRDLTWLKRLMPLIGIPLALLIASPWLLVRIHQDGTPFAGMSWREFLGALGGAQDMKLRAYPGTFILALLLGFLPATALLGTAAAKLWNAREERLPRFLLAWVIGYLVYLEAISSKPGTYMVQTMFPALALAVASVVVAEMGTGKRPEWAFFPWPTGLIVLPIAVFAGIYWFAGELPSISIALAIVLIMALFILSGQQGREGRLRRWAATGVAALALLAVTLLGAVLPSIDKIWPAREISRAIATCGPAAPALLGFREPSSRFVLGVSPAEQTADAIATQAKAGSPGVLVVEDRWAKRARTALAKDSDKSLGEPKACVFAYNVMRGCPLHFRIYEMGGQSCAFPAQFGCSDNAEPAGPAVRGDCD